MKHQLHPIRTEADYEAALKSVEVFFGAPQEPDPNSAEGAYFEALVTLIEGYERKLYFIEPPTPIEAIKFRMERAGLSVADMEPYIGSRDRVYEVLAGTRRFPHQVQSHAGALPKLRSFEFRERTDDLHRHLPRGGGRINRFGRTQKACPPSCGTFALQSNTSLRARIISPFQ